MAIMERQRRSDEAAAVDTARSEPFAAGTSIARYKIVSLLGSGAMGDVYRAHDRALGRDIALKVLPPDLTGDRERVRRFAHEARAASALSHPHIVGIHEVGHAKPVIHVQPIGQRPQRHADVHYIAMELVEGETLREALQNGLSLRKSVELLAQVADGLGKAHAAGIVHRDLKPDNILVSQDGYAKIVDFGLAKLTDTTWNPIGADSPTLRALTAHGELLGTPGYMAPEQIVGKPLDARADVFSFGCILYEAIAHARPFDAESFVDTLYKIIHEDPTPLTQLAPATPPELQRIVERCLAKDREARYQSIRDVAADLRQWHGESGPRSTPVLAAGPLRPRISARMMLLFALLCALPVLAFILFGRPDQTPAIEQKQVAKLTSDGHAYTAVISPDGRYVAYITFDANGSTVWLEQITTGRSIVIVPASDAHYTGLAFSRDGEYIFFARYDSGALGNLYRIPILGGTPELLSKDIDSRATIAPDSRQYAFVRDDYNKGTSTIMVANADGSNERALAVFRMPDRVMQPAWSPDGSAIVAIQRAKLVKVDAKSGAISTVDTGGGLEAFRGVGWSDESHLITAATTNEAGGSFRLWRIDLGGGKATPLTSDLTDLVNPTVSDTGSIAALQVIRQSNIFEIGSGKTVNQLTTGIGSFTGLSGVAWLGDRVIYGSVADGKMDLFSRKGTEITRLTDDTLFEMAPAPSADGSFIAYASSGGGRQTLWRVRPDGTERVELTEGPRDGAFAISPDSKSIAYASFEAKANEWVLYVMPAGGGPRRRVTSAVSVLEGIRYAPDGRTLFFTAYENSALRLYRVPAKGGKVEHMIDGRTKGAALSPDGSTIAAHFGSPEKFAAPAVLVPVRGGAVKRLELDGAMYAWHPDGKALSYVREEKGAMNLWLRPLGANESKQVTWFSDGSIAHYAWNGDGSRAAVVHTVDAMDVVLIR
jgi:eukaryotic-like serine/threonine-protein kinase